MVVGGVEHAGRVEAREQHGRGTGQEGPVGADAQPVGVEHREAVDQAVLRRPAPGQHHRRRGGQQVGVPEHRPLGQSGRPGGEADQGRVVGGGPVEPRHLAVRQLQGRRRDQGRAPRRLGHPASPLRVVDDDGRRPHVGGDVGQLGPGVGGVGRHHHQAGPQGADMGHQGGDRGAGRPDHPVPGHQAGPRQPPGRPTGGLVELGRRPPAPRASAPHGGRGPVEEHRRVGPAAPAFGPGPGQGPGGGQVVGRHGAAGGKVVLPGNQARAVTRFRGFHRLIFPLARRRWSLSARARAPAGAAGRSYDAPG